MSPLDSRFVKAADLVTRVLADETLIVPVTVGVVDLGRVYVLDEVGSVVWAAIDGTSTVAALVDRVCADYQVERETAERDVIELLESLKAAKLIVEQPVSPATP